MTGLIRYITSSPVMAMVWEGPNAVAAVRQTMGSTRPTEAAPGSLRHDFALEVGRNLTHASDTVENGEKEVALWFQPAECVRGTGQSIPGFSNNPASKATVPQDFFISPALGGGQGVGIQGFQPLLKPAQHPGSQRLHPIT